NQQDYRGKAEIIISKHRNGEVGIVLLRFKAEHTRFMNLDDDIHTGNYIGSNKAPATTTNTQDLPPEIGGTTPAQPYDDPLGGSMIGPDDVPY
ncbi:MAG: replicative DNA helicase, partial [Bacteroidaceae bacterium]